MSKPYTWEEIKSFLKKELQKTKHIMTFGTIGSCNVETDIDTIITKKPSSKSSSFYKEIHNLFDKLDIYLKKSYKGNVVLNSPASRRASGYLLKKNKSNLFFDIMIYTSYPQIKNDWNWARFYHQKINDLLKKDYQLIKGKKEDLFGKKFMKKTYCDSIFLYVYQTNVIYSKLPEKLTIKIMNDSLDFLYRKKLGLRVSVAKNKNEIKKHFYALLDILDKINKKKKVK